MLGNWPALPLFFSPSVVPGSHPRLSKQAQQPRTSTLGNTQLIVRRRTCRTNLADEAGERPGINDPRVRDSVLFYLDFLKAHDFLPMMSAAGSRQLATGFAVRRGAFGSLTGPCPKGPGTKPPEHVTRALEYAGSAFACRAFDLDAGSAGRHEYHSDTSVISSDMRMHERSHSLMVRGRTISD
jgi:hypothetical protein